MLNLQNYKKTDGMQKSINLPGQKVKNGSKFTRDISHHRYHEKKTWNYLSEDWYITLKLKYTILKFWLQSIPLIAKSYIRSLSLKVWEKIRNKMRNSQKHCITGGDIENYIKDKTHQNIIKTNE